eukprot:s459_g28.t1
MTGRCNNLTSQFLEPDRCIKDESTVGIGKVETWVWLKRCTLQGVDSKVSFSFRILSQGQRQLRAAFAEREKAEKKEHDRRMKERAQALRMIDEAKVAQQEKQRRREEEDLEEGLRFSYKLKKIFASTQSKFQQVDVCDTEPFGRVDHLQSFALAMDCLGLAVAWEKCDSLRDRIRQEKKVLIYPEEDSYCKANRVNAVVNGDVLVPILKRLQNTDGNKLPYIEDLTAETTLLYQKCGLSCSGKAPYKMAVELKRLAGFVKRRAYRKEVTKEKG